MKPTLADMHAAATEADKWRAEDPAVRPFISTLLIERILNAAFKSATDREQRDSKPQSGSVG